MSNVRVGAAIAASFGYLSTAWSRATGIMAAGVILAIALELAQPTLSSLPALGILVFLVRICIGTMTTGALYRIGIGPDHPGDAAYAVGPAGFQWGGLEWRVLGANVLLAVLFIVPLVVIIIVWGIGLGVSAGHSGLLQDLQSPDDSQRLAALGHLMMGPAGVVSAAILIPAVLVLIYVAARLALYVLWAADTGSFSLGQAWRLTRGAVLALIVTAVVVFVAELVAAAVVNAAAGLIAGFAGHHRAGGIWGGRAGEAVDAAINAPLFAGLMLYVYRAKRGETSAVATLA